MHRNISLGLEGTSLPRCLLPRLLPLPEQAQRASSQPCLSPRRGCGGAVRGGKAGATCSGNGIRALPFGWGRKALPLKLRKPSLDIAPGAPSSCVAAPCHPAHRSGPSAAPCPLPLQPPLGSGSSAPRCPRCTKHREQPQLRRRALSSQPLSVSSHAFPAAFPGRGLPRARLGLCSPLLTPPAHPPGWRARAEPVCAWERGSEQGETGGGTVGGPGGPNTPGSSPSAAAHGTFFWLSAPSTPSLCPTLSKTPAK